MDFISVGGAEVFTFAEQFLSRRSLNLESFDCESSNLGRSETVLKRSSDFWKMPIRREEICCLQNNAVGRSRLDIGSDKLEKRGRIKCTSYQWPGHF